MDDEARPARPDQLDEGLDGGSSEWREDPRQRGIVAQAPLDDPTLVVERRRHCDEGVPLRLHPGAERGLLDHGVEDLVAPVPERAGEGQRGVEVAVVRGDGDDDAHQTILPRTVGRPGRAVRVTARACPSGTRRWRWW